MRRAIISFIILLASTRAYGAGPDDPLTQYWHNRMDVQLAPVDIPDPAHPGETIKVFKADDLVKFMDGTLADLNLWADDIDPNRGNRAPLITRSRKVEATRFRLPPISPGSKS